MYHPFLLGKKLYLRGIENKDLEGNYFDWLNDYEVTKYMDSGQFPNSIEKMQEYVKNVASSTNNVLLCIIDIATDKHIGNVRLGPINWINRTAFVGIMIGDKEFWGRGYATETIELVSEYAFKRLNLHKISAGVNASNQASVKAFKNAGFRIEGVRKDEVYADGQYHDGVQLTRKREARHNEN